MFFMPSNEIKIQQLTKQTTKNRPFVIKNRQRIENTRRLYLLRNLLNHGY